MSSWTYVAVLRVPAIENPVLLLLEGDLDVVRRDLSEATDSGLLGHDVREVELVIPRAAASEVMIGVDCEMTLEEWADADGVLMDTLSN